MSEKGIGVKTLIGLGVIAIIVVALIGALASESQNRTSYTTIEDETYNLSSGGCYVLNTVNVTDTDCNITVTNYPQGWQTEDCPISSVVVENSAGGDLTLDTDYKLYASDGVIVMLNTTATNNSGLGSTALINYKYCGTGYVNSSWGRDLLNMTPAFVVIALLIAIVAGAYILLGRDKED